ncbi:hypothetical protein B484DRAFT_437765, partial [Ochromonadaceae sp. CCMP2298]
MEDEDAFLNRLANVVDDDKSVADIETGYLEELAEGAAMEVEQLGDAGEPVSAAADDAENDFLSDLGAAGGCDCATYSGALQCEPCRVRSREERIQVGRNIRQSVKQRSDPEAEEDMANINRLYNEIVLWEGVDDDDDGADDSSADADLPIRAAPGGRAEADEADLCRSFWDKARMVKKDKLETELYCPDTAVRVKGNDSAKAYAWDQTLIKMEGFSCSDHKVCKHGGQCVGETALNSICSLRNSFWGTSALKAPSAMERGQRIEEELRRSFNARDKTFSFQVKGRDVCERGYLILLGLITRESRAPRQWIRVKKELEEEEEGGRPVVGGGKGKGKGKGMKRGPDKRSFKRNHCDSYIEYVARLYADTFLTDGNILCLPYETPAMLFREYVNFCECADINPAYRAQVELFRQVLLSKADRIRMIGCKGSFQTCDTCNNCNDMLRAPKSRYDSAQREIILKYKRLHLQQQAQERKTQEQNRMHATHVTNGQPDMAYILSDGMTAMSGDTPKVGGGGFRRGKKDTKWIANRII